MNHRNEDCHHSSGSVDDPVEVAQRAIHLALGTASKEDLSWLQLPKIKDRWPLSRDALMFLSALVRVVCPRHVVEFGTGLSTRVLARACSELDLDCRVTSVDHDPEYMRRSRNALGDEQWARCTKFHLAPLVTRKMTQDEGFMPVYHLSRSAFASKRRADIVLIDGPPNGLGGRQGTLYQALEFSRPGTIVLLDDADRQGELKILESWQRELGRKITVTRLPGFEKGLAAIVIREGREPKK